MRLNTLCLSCATPWRLKNPFLRGLQGQLLCQALEQGSPRWGEAFNAVPFCFVLSPDFPASTTFWAKTQLQSFASEINDAKSFPACYNVGKKPSQATQRSNRQRFPSSNHFFLNSAMVRSDLVHMSVGRGRNDFRKLLSVVQLSSHGKSWICPYWNQPAEQDFGKRRPIRLSLRQAVVELVIKFLKFPFLWGKSARPVSQIALMDRSLLLFSLPYSD